jgi:hypothetical protein
MPESLPCAQAWAPFSFSAFQLFRAPICHLLSPIFVHLNPMPYEAAAQMEKDLTEDLRRVGFTVVGGL